LVNSARHINSNTGNLIICNRTQLRNILLYIELLHYPEIIQPMVDRADSCMKPNLLQLSSKWQCTVICTPTAYDVA